MRQLPSSPGRERWTSCAAEEPVKKPLTAETAETAEKKILRILGELCVLCGKTPHFFTRSEVGFKMQKWTYGRRLTTR